MIPRIMYIELVSGYNHDGPARIGRVTFSKTGRTVYYAGKTFRRVKKGTDWGGNHVDVETGESYWISGVKKNREDRHWAGMGSVEIDDDIRAEYFGLIGTTDPEAS